ELVIDPGLAWATYYGGTGGEQVYSAATDATGNVYMAGVARRTSRNATTRAHQLIFGGSTDAFLVKFNSAGMRQWATYYGGSGQEDAYVTTDAFSNVYLFGSTESISGIATGGAYQSASG